MSHTEHKSSSIDAVITWVDGNDPAHRRKREALLGKSSCKSESPIAAGHHETRFADNGELRYCLASIHKFAPWIRYIHLVTDNQKPSFLTPELVERYRVKYVDHQEIFDSFEWALPTFNSRSIETVIWRIPGLAEKFLYFNDDFLITKSVSPEDFFSNGNVLVRGAWRSMPYYGIVRKKADQFINSLAENVLGRTRTMHPLAQMRGAQLAGVNARYFHTPHVPHPVHKSTLASYFAKNAHSLTQNIAYPFRDFNQFWIISLAHHLEIAAGHSILADADDAAPISGERHSVGEIRNKLKAVRGGQLRFLCLTALERTDPVVRKEIDATLSAVLDLRA